MNHSHERVERKGATSFLPGEGLKCAEPEEPRFRGEETRRGDRIQGKGCPLSLGKKNFEF